MSNESAKLQVPVRMIDLTNRIREEAPDLIPRLSFHDLDRLAKAFSVFKHGEQESACRDALAELVRLQDAPWPDREPSDTLHQRVTERMKKESDTWAAARVALEGKE